MQQQGREWADQAWGGAVFVALMCAISYPLPRPELLTWGNTDLHQQYHWHRSDPIADQTSLQLLGLTLRRPPAAVISQQDVAEAVLVLLHRCGAI